MKRKYTKEELSELLKEYGTVSKDWDGDYLYSARWVRGGISYGWHGDKYKVEPEKPNKFVELHKFLKDKFPNLTYMEFVEIEDNCVDTYDDHESDYYSELDVTSWRCNIEKLAEYLPEFHDYDYEMTCKKCGTTFRFDEDQIDDIEGGLMGDWTGVWCPGCHGYVETYPDNRTKLH